MPKTQTLNSFTAGSIQTLSEAATVRDIIFSNVTSSDITVTLKLDVGGGTTHVFKDLVIPGNTALQLDGFQFQTSRGKLSASTNTTNGLEVIYTVV